MKVTKQDIRSILTAAVFVSIVLHGFGSGAQGASLSGSLGVVIYPSKGQSPAKQNKDEGKCYAWAKEQTGIDPVAVAVAPTQEPGPAVGGGERVRGAARGALGGAAIGAIAGDVGKGAGIGAVAGTMAGGRQARKNKAAKQQQAEQAKGATIQHFNKAFGACMEARGYLVK
ncbi:MAG: glycine zipper domain-containing protein [Nitrospiraceae bacterium]|nr:glycine zipper domain-containing protein [Nitrospiraceae bacterium]